MGSSKGGAGAGAFVIGGAALAAAAILFSFGAASAQVSITAKVPGVCGNDISEIDEQCEPGPPEDLGGASCVSLGFASGDLSCAPSCLFDTSACVPIVSGGKPKVFEGGGGVPSLPPLPEFILPPPPPVPFCPFISYDLNGDGVVDLQDLSILLFWLPRTEPGALVYDLNCDGKLDFADISVLFYHWTDFSHVRP